MARVGGCLDDTRFDGGCFDGGCFDDTADDFFDGRRAPEGFAFAEEADRERPAKITPVDGCPGCPGPVVAVVDSVSAGSIVGTAARL